MNRLQKTIILGIFILMHTNHSFGMLRTLAQRATHVRIPKHTRPIMIKLPPNDLKEAISECKRVNNFYKFALNRNYSVSPQDKEIRLLLQAQTSLVENIKHLNNENLKTLKQPNASENYDVHDYLDKIELIQYLEDELAGRGLFHAQKP